MTLSGIAGINGSMLTVSRELYEEGPGDERPRLHFASYGDPIFDKLMQHLNQFELPGCVQRIVIQVPGMNRVEMIGYAAVCRQAGGNREVRLITAWDDLKGLNLAETDSLSESEINSLREELIHTANREFGHYLAAARIERDNLRSAWVQVMLDILVIYDLLDAKMISAGSEAPIRTVLNEVSSLFDQREQIRANNLPADLLRPVKEDLLFDCQVPNMGDQAYLLVPRALGRAAIDAASRLIYGKKERKNDLTVDTVLKLLRRHLEITRQKLN